MESAEAAAVCQTGEKEKSYCEDVAMLKMLLDKALTARGGREEEEEKKMMRFLRGRNEVKKKKTKR